MPHDSSEWVSPKSMYFQVLGQKIYPIQEMIRPKMMPWSKSIHWKAPSLLFYQYKLRIAPQPLAANGSVFIMRAASRRWRLAGMALGVGFGRVVERARSSRLRPVVGSFPLGGLPLGVPTTRPKGDPCQRSGSLTVHGPCNIAVHSTPINYL